MAVKIPGWLWEQANIAGRGGYVVGISGGIDSAVAAKLAVMGVGGGNVRAFHFPVEKENPLALAVTNWLGIGLEVCNLSIPYHSLIDELGNRARDRVAWGNIQARLRMTSLYYMANCYNGLVLGTSNKTELAIGYFTKYGDGGVDVEPLGDMYKHQVRGLAVHLGVPTDVINAAPSAGLWEGQTDEEEIGMSYGQIDQAITNSRWANVKEHQWPTVTQLIKINRMMKTSQHKREMPPIYGERK